MDKESATVAFAIAAAGIALAAGLAAGAFLLAPYISSAPEQPRAGSAAPSIEMDGPRATYTTGERLDFTVHTYGQCATPNVVISRGGGRSVLVYQHMGDPVRCPSQEPGSNIHFEWKAKELVERISNEYYGGNNGDSELARDAAIVLTRAGNYTVTASLLDWSDSVTKKFTVVDGGGAPPSNIMQVRRMNLTSVTAYTTAHEVIGAVVPGMEFANGEPVFVQSVFSNPYAAPVSPFILSSTIRDQSPDPLPDQYASVTGDAALHGKTIALEQLWVPERAGGYTVLIFSLTDADLKSTIPVSPVAAIPVKVVAAEKAPRQ